MAIQSTLLPRWLQLCFLGAAALLGCADIDSDVDAQPNCEEDRFYSVGPPALELGTLAGLIACPENPDTFSLSETLMDPLEIVIIADAEVDVVVRGGSFMERTGRGTELVFRGGSDGDVIRIEVSGRGARYGVEVRAVRSVMGCDGVDELELQALPLVLDGQSVCPEGHYWQRVEAPVGALIRFELASGMTPLSLEIFELSDGVLLRSQNIVVAEESNGITMRGGTSHGSLFVRVQGQPEALFQLKVSSMQRGAQRRTLSGRLMTWRRAVSMDGLSQPEAVPGRYSRIDVMGDDGGLLASLLTDGEGYFSAVAMSRESEVLSLKVLAEAWSGRGMVRVGPGAGDDRPWSEIVQGVVQGQDERTINLPVGSTTGVALAVAMTGADGLRAVHDVLPAWTLETPPVRYRWRPNGATDCGTCYRPGSSPLIELSGSEEDPDEWDTAVIFHELGHYIANVYGRDDSPGGPHSGARTRPTVAWSEGFATFMSSVLLGSATQLDYRISDVKRIDLETYAESESFGTADGSMEGEVSEYLVATLLWDLLDDPDDDDDAVAMSLESVLRPIFMELRELSDDRGYSGLDLVDYLQRLHCVGGITGLEALITERRFPFTPDVCGD